MTSCRIKPWVSGWTGVVCLLGWAGYPPQVTAGDGGCPVDVREVGHWDMVTGDYADVWAEGNNAYVGRYSAFGGDGNGVHFFDLTNPAAPQRFLEWIVGPPNTFASAQDVKTGDGMLFIALEADNNDGVEIVDIRDPLNPAHLTWVTVPGMSEVHNVFYDSGFLYIVNSRTPDVAIVDLNNFDLDNPPVRITQFLWDITAGTSFVHDITVQDGVLYACAWDSGLYVYNVSNVANAPPVFMGSASGNNTHSVWPSADGRWAVTGEERTGGPIKLYEIVPNGGGVNVILRDTVALPDSETNSAHNPIVVGTRVYVSWYQAGLRVLDIDEDQGVLVDLGGYDTFGGGPAGFDGAWGVYPFLGEDRILISDITNGLFVLDARSLASIDYPDGLVTTIDPIDGATLTVEIGSDCGAADPSTARVSVEIEPGDSVFDIPLEPIGGDLYEAHLPGAPCGSVYSYYVAVDTTEGDTVFDPPGAPGVQYQADVVSSVQTLFVDDFEANLGWTIGNDTCAGVAQQTGQWERVDPNGSAAAPENDFGDGTMCYVTQQGPVGGSSGEADVDGGPFRLTSPPMVIDGQDAVVRYARWVVSNDSADTLVVEASGDDGQSWVLVEDVGDHGPQWIVHEFLISDVMTPTATVRLRFSIQDCPNDSVTEAGVDEVSVVVIECIDDAEPPFIVHDAGVNTRPFSGYVDPRRESDNGVDVNEGVNTVSILFSEPVRNVGGADIDASAFTVLSTGAAPPTVASIDATGNPIVVVTLSGPLTPGSWYTILANVEDLASNVIVNQGDLGPGVNEPDRVDIAFLPADVDQNGEVGPFDLLLFRQLVNGMTAPLEGTLADFIDTDRDGEIGPFDLLTYRQLVNGVSPATQPWSGATLDAPRP